MSKRKLAEATQPSPKKTPLDVAEEQAAQTPQPPASAPARLMSRTTDRISISLLPEERTALEARAHEFMRNGRRDIKPSRLARIAFKMLLAASDEEILQVVDEVPNLEKLRAK